MTEREEKSVIHCGKIAKNNGNGQLVCPTCGVVLRENKRVTNRKWISVLCFLVGITIGLLGGTAFRHHGDPVDNISVHGNVTILQHKGKKYFSTQPNNSEEWRYSDGTAVENSWPPGSIGHLFLLDGLKLTKIYQKILADEAEAKQVEEWKTYIKKNKLTDD